VRQTLNRDFYTTSAAVIPLILLAITFQSPTFAAITARIRESEQSSSRRVRIVGWLLQLVAAAILVAGIGGEIVAISVLRSQHATPSTDGFVCWAETLLIGFLLLTLLPSTVPGLVSQFGVRVDFDAARLELRPGEETLWSDKAVRWSWWAQTSGKLFVTNQRVAFVLAPPVDRARPSREWKSWECDVSEIQRVWLGGWRMRLSFPAANVRVNVARRDDLLCQVTDLKAR
jgi:hypothetical protein